MKSKGMNPLKPEEMKERVSLNASCQDKVYDFSFKDDYYSIYYGHLTNKRILDVGCGSGKLGEFLARRGNECYGVTISEAEAAMAKNKLREVAVLDIENVESLPFSKHSFDVVIFSDVLEHLRNPERALVLVKAYLKPEGTVIVSVPNVANVMVRWKLCMGKFDYELHGILDNTHVRFFTLKTAKNFLTNNGFAIQQIKFTNWNWRFSKVIEKLFTFCEWEIRDRMTRWWPGLFATQFVIYATNTPNDGECNCGHV